MNEIIRQVEKQYIKKDKFVKIKPGDSVEVKTWITEGNKKRLQLFSGTVIAINNKGVNSTFTIRKISNGEGIERVFNFFSPIIEDISIKRHGSVRKSKLYYLRNRTGKLARIKERLT